MVKLEQKRYFKIAGKKDCYDAVGVIEEIYNRQPQEAAVSSYDESDGESVRLIAVGFFHKPYSGPGSIASINREGEYIKFNF